MVKWDFRVNRQFSGIGLQNTRRRYTKLGKGFSAQSRVTDE
jgi:hypothetical protein